MVEEKLITEAADWRRYDNNVTPYQQWAAHALIYATGPKLESYKNLVCHANIRHSLAYFIDPRGIIRKLRAGQPSGRGLVSVTNSIINWLELWRASGSTNSTIFTSGDDHLAMNCTPGIHQRVETLTGWEARGVERTPHAYGAAMLGNRNWGDRYERALDKVGDLLTTSSVPYWLVNHAEYRAVQLTKDATHVGLTSGKLGVLSHYRNKSFLEYVCMGHTQAADTRLASQNYLDRFWNLPSRDSSIPKLRSSSSIFPMYENDNLLRRQLALPPRYRACQFNDVERSNLSLHEKRALEALEREKVAGALSLRASATFRSTVEDGGYQPVTDINQKLWKQSWNTNEYDRYSVPQLVPDWQAALQDHRQKCDENIQTNRRVYITKNTRSYVPSATPMGLWEALRTYGLAYARIERLNNQCGANQYLRMYRTRTVPPLRSDRMHLEFHQLIAV
jgi:hypothetical protein